MFKDVCAVSRAIFELTRPHLPRFMAYLSLFTFFMLILVTADSARLAQGLRSEMLLYRNLEIKINMSFSCRLI